MKNLRQLAFFLSIGAMIVLVNLIWFLPVARSLRSNVSALEAEIVGGAVFATDHFMEERIIELNTFASFFERDMNDPRNEFYLERILKSEYFTKASLINRKGDELFRRDKFKVISEKDIKSFSGEHVFEGTLTTERPFIGRVIISELFEPFVDIGIPVFEYGTEGNIRGVLMMTFDIKSIFDIIAGVSSSVGGRAYIVDKDGLLIVHPDTSLVLKNLNYTSRAIVADVLDRKRTIVSDDDIYTYINEDGIKVLAVGGYIEDTGWAVIFEEPRKEALSNLRVVQISTLLAILIVMFLLFVLIRNSTRLVEARRFLQGALNESNKLATIAEKSFEGVVVVDPAQNYTFTYVNPMWEAMTGWSKDEVVGKETPRILKSGKHDQAFYKKMWNTILEGKIFVGDLVNKRKDGTLYDTDIAIFPIKDGHGKTIFFAEISRDITEKKKIERKLQTRTDEVERFNKLMVGRELKMIELKKEIEALKKEISTKKD
ncbi:MAG: hypothetical protein BMS9Abin13_016 [Patescibacteria group bacterium]|nr:MAG: hypothetical protein BMS9Abin13_016 [Patescibacteria group bacterium]